MPTASLNTSNCHGVGVERNLYKEGARLVGPDLELLQRLERSGGGV